MSLVPHTVNTFTFQGQLADKLRQASTSISTGYWQIQLESGEGTSQRQTWYLAVSQKRIIFSGFAQLNWSLFLDLLKRYIPRLRSASVQQQLQIINQRMTDEQKATPIVMLGQIVAKGFLEYREITQAVHLQVLTDFDTYLFNYSGKAQFVADPHLLKWPTTIGSMLDSLLAEDKQRRLQWNHLEPYVSSIEAIPKLNSEMVERQITVGQKQQLQQLTSQGKTLREIAYDLGQDPLKLAQTFASLSQKGLVTITRHKNTATSTTRLFIVDDSPVILQQFKSVVTNLGYQVNCCSDALTAVSEMLAFKPAAIFLDVNMPEVSGFQLIKQIRLQPQLASVPLVILTAENSLSNKMRAEWSKSKFLSKPLNSSDMSTFYSTLRSLLQEIAPLTTSSEPK